MRVSIAMATFNGAKYLPEQLESFCRQTRQPDELIVCDDQSTDTTVSILQEFRRSAPFPVTMYVNEGRLGFSGNFGRALSLCRGDVVLLSDQDDVWLPSKVETLIGAFETHSSIQLIIHDLEYCNEKLVPLAQTKIERIAAICDPQTCYVNGMATAIRGNFLRVCLPIPHSPGLTHDRWLHTCAAAVHGKLLLRSVLVLHRRHGNNATATRWVNSDQVMTRASLRRQGQLYRLRSMFSKTPWCSGEDEAIDEWLKLNRNDLVTCNYASPEDIDREMKTAAKRAEDAKARSNILRLPRHRRVIPVLGMLQERKYQSFSGWRSAVKDLLIN